MVQSEAKVSLTFTGVGLQTIFSHEILSAGLGC